LLETKISNFYENTNIFIDKSKKLPPKIFSIPTKMLIFANKPQKTMENSLNITFPLDMALYFVQSLPNDYQNAILQMLLNKSQQETAATQKLSFEYGAAKSAILYVAPDFNAPLEDFNEYM
jgi:hypothetical protein